MAVGLTVGAAVASGAAGSAFSTYTAPSTTTSAPSYTRTYKPTKTPTPTVSDGSFGPGMHLVGSDIQPGTYRATVPAGSNSCYWERLSGTSGTFDDIISNELARPGEQTIVTIQASDAAFQSKRCGTWTKV